MKILVYGLWHLGTVTAACMGSYGHKITAIDDDRNIVENLKKAKLPVQEPG